MILVVGGTGMLGQVLSRRLAEEGERVRVMTRDPQQSSAQTLKASGIEIVEGDLRDRASIAVALQGADRVVAAAHAFAGPKSKGDNNPDTVDDAGHRALIDASKDAGVRHFVYISVFGARPDHPSVLFRVKYKIEEYLKESGLSYTILRAGPFMEMWGMLIGGPILASGKTTVFGSGKNPINFVAVEDVASFAALALRDPALANRTVDVGGPENLTLDGVVTVYEEVSGTQAKVTHVPVPVMRAMSLLMKPFNPAMSRQIQAGACMDTLPQAFDMTDTCSELEVELTPMRSIAERAAGAPPA